MPSDAVYVILRGSQTTFIWRWGVRAELSPSEATVFVPILVATASGAPDVPLEALVEALYGHRRDGGPDDANNVARQFIHRIRCRLAPLGIGIVARWDFGYYAVLVEPQEYKRRGRHTGASTYEYING